MADPTVFSNAYVGVTTATGGTYAVLQGNKEVTFPISRAELADSVMGDTVEAIYPGVLSAPVTLLHRQDFTTAATGVDKKVWAAFNNRTAIKFKVRPVNAAVSSTNPSYILNRVYITGLTPVSGSWGQALENRIEIRAATGCTLSRSTAT